ncbi:sigma-54 dependent transcriptional regulator [Ekhidna sp.]|uniref:sigma-54-dependent transcriptional regulator n=1 Tax=Ekhidna sp. TaxID=2608089 RepID=UPI003296E423
MAKILVVDDEKSIRDALSDILSEEKYEVLTAEDGEDGWAKLEQEKIDLVLCDIKMPKMDGMELLNKVSQEGLDVPFVMISAHGTIDTAVEATKKGAYDFIQKPPDLNRILLTVRNALDNSKLSTETKVLRKKVSKGFDIIGESDGIVEVKNTIEKVAPTEARVLINGENGTGKELVARWLHEKSNRSKSPLVEVNCAAIPSELIESELFGHEKGSFTSAHKQRIGKFEQAHGGTLFLDEIGDMSLSAQAKVLRALQDKKITRVGGDKTINVDVRVLAATNKNLKKEIEQGNFREDLYHRLSVMVITVPALRERKEDIKLLTDHFLDQVASEYGTAKKLVEDNAIDQLESYEWTGNIRELRNVVERLVIMSQDTITKEDVKKYVEA